MNMDIKETIEITIPEAMLTDVTKRAVQAAFAGPDYHDKGGIGHRLIVDAVDACLKETDFSLVVRESIDKMLRSTVEEIVADKMKKIGKEVVKRIMAGTDK
jgi:hypothetical protein